MDDSTSNDLRFEHYTHKLLYLTGVTILCYDHMITLGDEYRCIWRASCSAVSVIFFLTRYVTLFTTIVTTWATTFTISLESYLKFEFFHQISLIATQSLVASMQFLRTYALYSKSKRIAALLLSVAAAAVILIVWIISHEVRSMSLSPSDRWKRGTPGPSLDSESSPTCLAGLWEVLLAYDIMIFLLTVIKTREGWLKYRASNRLDILSIMYRDGAMNFGVILIAQCANVYAFYALPPTLQGSFSTLATAISVSMVSRLTLNLRQLGTRDQSTLIPRSSTAITGSNFTTQIVLTEYDEDAFDNAEEEASHL